MSGRRVRLAHEARVVLLAMAAGLPGVCVSLVLLWGGDRPLKVQVTLTAIVVLVWLGVAGSLGDRVARPLHTLANLLAALREGDFSIRARTGTSGASLDAVHDEINALGETLREQRLGAIEAHALLRTVMLEIDVAVLAFDADHRLRLANRAAERLLRAPPTALVGKTAGELRLSHLLEGDGARTVTVELPGAGRRADGTPALPSVDSRWEMRRAAFRQKGAAASLVLLTDVKRALREEERQVWQRLVRVLGHEINNSLAPIGSIARELRDGHGRTPREPDWAHDVARGLEVIERRAEALGRFMAAYARLARLPDPVLTPVDVGAWVRRVARLDRRVPVVVEPGPTLSVSGDADQLDQLLINLVRNAVDASLETRATVALTWKQDAEHVEVVVTDGGPGIAQASNLFVPFFTTKPEGTGIGLVLSRQIAEAHSGGVTLADRVEGPGCRAIVRLPLQAVAGGLTRR
jgi:nitrogen fixation/metabolism regulation signal transduction histidine kinase